VRRLQLTLTEFCVLLRSRLNDLTQAYNFTISSLVPTAFASSASPTVLDLNVDAPGHTLQITMELCVFQGDLTSNNLGSGRQYIARGLRFFKLFMLRSDLSVHESILYATSPLIRGEGHDATVRNVSWTRAYRPRHDVRTVRKVQEMDDFVELEGMETLEVPVSKLASQAPKVVEGKEMDTAHRVVDHRTIYDALLQRRSTGIAAAELVDIPTVVKQLAELLTDSTDLSQLPISTL
jgi:RNA polymerase I-specific transcription initiation factor RRN6